MYSETAQFYDFFGQNIKESERRASFIGSCIQDKYASIIDIGAGAAEAAFMLADEGHTLFCFEPSPPMYAMLLERLRLRKDLHSYISAFPCRIEDVEAPLIADVIYAFSVFSHLSLEQRKNLLKGVKKHLKKDGFFLFNCVQNASQREDQERTLVQEKRIGEITYKHFAHSQGNKFLRKVTFEYEVEYQGQLIKKYQDDFVMNFDTLTEVKALLNQFGLQIKDIYSSASKEQYSEAAPGFFVVASEA